MTSACLNQSPASLRGSGGQDGVRDTAGLGRERLSLSPVRVSGLADAIADKLRELILTGELADGERLPSVDVLTQQFGVSWTATREALRILQSEGLVTVQRGKHGGAVVRYPSAATAGYAVALVLKSLGADVQDVVETRGHIEPVCAALCARRPDRNESIVPELRQQNAASRDFLDTDDNAFIESLLAFHRIIVEGCGSSTLTLLAGIIDSISRAMLLHRFETEAPAESYPRAAKLASLAIHETICDLIAAGDDVRVAQVMAEHHAADAPKVAHLTDAVDPGIVRERRER